MNRNKITAATWVNWYRNGQLSRQAWRLEWSDGELYPIDPKPSYEPTFNTEMVISLLVAVQMGAHLGFVIVKHLL